MAVKTILTGSGKLTTNNETTFKLGTDFSCDVFVVSRLDQQIIATEFDSYRVFNTSGLVLNSK